MKGFITKDSEDLLFLDKYEYPNLIADIVLQIRNTIPNGLLEGILHIKYKCMNCLDKKGLPIEYLGKIPSYQDFFRFLDEDNTVVFYPCTKCGRQIGINILSFEQVDENSQTRIRDPFNSFRRRPDPFRRI